MKFTEWRDAYDPGPGTDTPELLTKDAAKQSFNVSLRQALDVLPLTEEWAKSIESRLIADWQEAFDTYYQKYAPPTEGCSSSPEKAIEHAMLSSWNRAVAVVLTEVDIRTTPETLAAFDALFYKEESCGKCDSEEGCSK